MSLLKIKHLNISVVIGLKNWNIFCQLILTFSHPLLFFFKISPFFKPGLHLVTVQEELKEDLSFLQKNFSRKENFFSVVADFKDMF